MKKKMLLLLTLLLALILAACGGDDAEPEEQKETTEVDVEITEEELVDEQFVVANINGSEITGDKYNNIYRQLKTMLFMYGQDVDDLDMLKDETLAILTDQELIRQDAEESGVEVTEEEAQEEWDIMIAANGEEAIETLLEQYGLTEEEFLNQLKDDLLTVKYIEKEFVVEISDEEVEEQYELLKEQHENIGEFAEYEEMIRRNLTEMKQSELLDERLNELKENAEIETYI